MNEHENTSPGSSTADAKKELRRSVRTARKTTYGGEDGARRRAEEAQQLRSHGAALIAALREDAPLTRVAAYRPTPTEADVMPLLEDLRSQGIELIFPVSAGEDLEWVLWDGGEFVPSPGTGFGDEPQGERLGRDALGTVDLVLAPAVAVDLTGSRIGHGAGFYDRAVGHRRPGTPVVAVVHPEELLPPGEVPIDDGDAPIDGVLTAAGYRALSA
ncbi:5-formyltetrahydrofolate cyclo-ligase [Brachybacterium sp. EF45031]|uniref:5-formyltetrahydrofolate cyclo-ligase n=1 Tax=Brachybacterium sillae TaxID=2810536 RepID=UPI00217D60F0|nr:5-formyltetrahydrofolate cyclo-ligase [Brachybacterium sillae]MCS6712621.1 5-formyltetrahydrofolate cyclo-ligase [Brachybacterium sillae]